MDTSKFIAKVLGLIYLSVGIGYIVSGKHYSKIFEAFTEPSLSTFLFSFILIVAGMAIVKYHNIWKTDWKIWITIFGWICVVKGILLFIFPNYPSRFIHLIEVPNDYFIGTGILFMLLGLMFGYFGFFHNESKNSKEKVT